MRGLYPGVDMTFSAKDGKLQTEITAASDANLAAVKVEYRGATGVALANDNIATVQTALGAHHFEGALIADQPATKLETHASSATSSASGVSLVYSTYLGGSSAEEGLNGSESSGGIAVDGSGNAYVTGATWSANFPVVNAYDASWNGSSDAFVTKLNPAGNAPVYSTYLGGVYSDEARSITVDFFGNAYVTGQTASFDFPTVNAYDASWNGLWESGFWRDAFVTKLNPSGNALVYSTYLGGTSDDWACDIAVDGSGNAYVTGQTASANFPVVNAYDGSLSGTYDAFITKLNPSGNALVYSTYLGGGSSDEAHSITVDGSRNAYVTGGTASANFPVVNAYDGSLSGSSDAFVTKLNPAGNALLYSTYLGGSDGDNASRVAIDGADNTYVTGFTLSPDFPTVNAYDWSYNGGGDVFITKLNPSGNALVYSTYLGGSNYDRVSGIAANGSGNAYVSAWTSSSDLPTVNPYDGSFNGGDYDAFVAKLGAYEGECIGFAGMFCDDFTTGAKPDWNRTEGTCLWTAAGGTWSASLTGTQMSCVQSSGNESWKNYRFEYSVKGIAGSDKIVRFRDNGYNHYFLNLRSDLGGQDELILAKYANGIETILQSVTWPSQNGVWFPMQIDCVDEHISVSVAGIPAISVDDFSSPLYSGGIGLVCYTGEAGICTIEFDNVKVSDPYPRITINEPSRNFMVGYALTLTGRVRYGDGSPYVPSSGNIGVEDPITSFSAITPVQVDGSFSYTTGVSTQSGVWMFIFGVNSGSGIVRQAYNVPVGRAEPIADNIIGSRTIQIPTGHVNRPLSVLADVFSARNMVEPFRVAGSHVIGGAKAMWGQMKGDVSTSWNRTTGSGVNHQVAQNMEMFTKKCNPLNPLDGDCANMAASFGWLVKETISDLLWAKAQEGVNLTHQVLPSVMDDCQHALWTQTLTTSQIVVGIAGAGSGKVIDIASAIATGADLGPVTEVIQNSADACLLNARVAANPYPFFAAIFEPTIGDTVILLGLIPKIPKAVVVSGFSPINIKVTDSKGRFIDNVSSNIPGAEYYRFDSDMDGDTEQVVIVPLDSIGDVAIEITPAPGANPTDRFSVVANYTYYQTPDTIADNLLISQMPSAPITVQTFENRAPGNFGLVTADNVLLTGFPCALNWSAAVDSNPGHIVSYSVVIAKQADFSDSAVFPVGTDTSFFFYGVLTQAKMALDTASYFWKVLAYDDWGATTASPVRSFSVEYCCIGTSGNVDCDVADVADISDLTALIDYLFISLTPLCCEAEANIDGDAPVDISDLTALIDHLFISLAPTAPCQ